MKPTNEDSLRQKITKLTELIEEAYNKGCEDGGIEYPNNSGFFADANSKVIEIQKSVEQECLEARKDEVSKLYEANYIEIDMSPDMSKYIEARLTELNQRNKES